MAFDPIWTESFIDGLGTDRVFMTLVGRSATRFRSLRKAGRLGAATHQSFLTVCVGIMYA